MNLSPFCVAPVTWLGSEKVNVLLVLCDLLNIVKEMNLQLSAHKHSPTLPPDNADAFSVLQVSTSKLVERLKPVVMR